MAYDAWQSLRLTNKKVFLGIFAAEAVLFGVCLWYPKDRLPLYSMIVTGVLMALYMILLIAHRRHASLMIKGIKVLPKYLCLMVLTVEVAGQCYFWPVYERNHQPDELYRGQAGGCRYLQPLRGKRYFLQNGTGTDQRQG